MKTEVNKNLIGKFAYKKYGYYSGLIGIIQENDFVTPYKLVFKAVGSTGAFERDLVLVELIDDEWVEVGDFLEDSRL